MIFRALLPALSLLLCVPAARGESHAFYLGGIQVNEADQEHWVQTLKSVGMNTVEVTVYAKQGDWDSDNLWYQESEESVLREIRAAKEAGLHVVLVLRVALDHAFPRNKFLWHGMIMPGADALLCSWFEKYQAFVVKWAQISETEGVDVLAIGSEMNALSATQPVGEMPPLLEYFLNSEKQNQQKLRVLKFADRVKQKDLWVRGFENYSSVEAYLDDQIAAKRAWAQQVSRAGDPHWLSKLNARRRFVNRRWGELIEEARKVYNGKLTYAANFDNYAEVAFWNQLDFIGINAYFPLRDPDIAHQSETSLRTALAEGWKKVFVEIDAFRGANKLAEKPILFTEIGYIRRTSTTLEPWSGFGFSVVGSKDKERLLIWNEQALDDAERAFAVEALHEVVRHGGEPLIGILYWKLTTQRAHVEIEPFVLVIGDKPVDPLQTALLKFLERK